MARFKEGKSGNPAGRPKGRQNLLTEDVKMNLTKILKSYWTPAKIRADLNKMTGRQRQELLVKIAAFILPRPNESSVKVDFESLPPETIEKIYTLIFDNGNN